MGERFSPPANIISSILNDDRKGRKNNRGFYLYAAKGVKAKTARSCNLRFIGYFVTAGALVRAAGGGTLRDDDA